MASPELVPVAQKQEDESQFSMLLIGETGSGKTSLFELFKNYEIQFGKDFDIDKVQKFVGPKLKGKLTRDQENARLMKSDTKASRSYNLKFDDFEMEIIDTPGLVDTEGKEIDEENIANIITKIREVKRIHCICLVINGTTCRLTPSMTTVIKEISKVFPYSFFKNLIVFFTQTSDVFNLTFETDIFQTMFSWDPRGMKYFYIQNPFARWLRAVQKNYTLPSPESEFGAGFRKLDEVISTIKEFEPIETKDFGAYRELTENIRKNIASIRICHDNIESKKKVRKELQECTSNIKGKLKELRNRVIQHDEIQIQPTKDRNMVCNYPKCYENCHLSCKCRYTGIIFRKLHRCQCFEETVCQVCDHSSAVHCKNRYKYEKITVCIRPFEGEDDDEDDSGIRKALENYEADIIELEGNKKKLCQTLLVNLEEFQSSISDYSLNRAAMEEMDDMKHQIKSISDHTFAEKAVKLLESTQKIIKNPSTKDPSLKDAAVRWARGILHLRCTTNITTEDVTTQYTQLSKFNSNSVASQLLHHAKDILTSFPLVGKKK